MRIIADIPEHIVIRVREKLNNGRYGSFESFILTALENQLVLENGDPLSGKSPEVVKEPDGSATVAELRLLERPVEKSHRLVSPPSFKELEKWGNPRTEGQLWMWGQINKLLPAKVALRVIINSLDETQEWADLSEIWQKASKVARAFGYQLRERDRQAGRLHGDKLSAAFPIGDNSEKSEWRFSTQFVGYIRKDGQLTGALPFLRMVSLRREKNKEWVGLTKAGIEFAALENPVLDGKETKYGKPFGAEEIQYYLSHISRHVAGEKYAFGIILRIIAKGVDDREDINKTLKEFVDKAWSAKVLNTERAGAMSRMYELGLIDKKKSGITVKYSVSESGQRFLESFNE